MWFRLPYYHQGRIQDFKLGGALKIFGPSGARRENFEVFRVKNHDFTQKKTMRPPPWIRPWSRPRQSTVIMKQKHIEIIYTGTCLNLIDNHIGFKKSKIGIIYSIIYSRSILWNGLYVWVERWRISDWSDENLLLHSTMKSILRWQKYECC